ncbi:MAG: ATP-dependent DNA helicase RecG [Candidatus Cloacimonadota bacterium]|nr:MAG: ATP-dependent DNA helicase RecG [Candidatus Cloacimonadota bacterium]
MISIFSEIKYLKGVGEKRARLLNKLNIFTIYDLMLHFPRMYINREQKTRLSDLKTDQYSALTGHIVITETISGYNGKKQLETVISDGESYLYLHWFKYPSYLPEKLKPGRKIWAAGVLTVFRGRPELIHPETEFLDEESRVNEFWRSRKILPVYPLTAGIAINSFRKLIFNAFSLYHNQISETLPEYLIKLLNFKPLHTAIQKIHFPNFEEEAAENRKRFIFEEFFYHQLLMAKSRMNHLQPGKGYVMPKVEEAQIQLINSLPFRLTDAQKRVIEEIQSDMASDRQMNRLLQGDVGSGKTVVTLFGIIQAVFNGFQAAVMVPTEILAEQHAKTLSKLLKKSGLNISCCLIKGGNYKGKKSLIQDVKDGKIQVIIGTHALIQKKIEYKNLGFAVIDEQHRFGVGQRALLASKDQHPDILHMSATPIPRSLAMTAYGDLDVSILDELPPTRKPVKTFWRSFRSRNEVYSQIEPEILKGRQVYIVCPLVEESDKTDLLDAVSLYEEIKDNIYPQFKSALLHGKMKTRDKDEIMNSFKRGEFNILIATTVIEVGVDVPNASVMIIEHAERFGLSQLHQLRGRVGRGAEQAFCYLISYQKLSKEGKERLSAMTASNSGFDIAEKDLEIRGPGDFYGTIQSGLPAFSFANLAKDRQILETARKIAFKIIAEDNEFNLEKNKIIKIKYDREYKSREKFFKI